MDWRLAKLNKYLKIAIKLHITDQKRWIFGFPCKGESVGLGPSNNFSNKYGLIARDFCKMKGPLVHKKSIARAKSRYYTALQFFSSAVFCHGAFELPRKVVNLL